MRTIDRLTRHARLTLAGKRALRNPPFLVLFVNSICNMSCEHCFYWRSLNQRDDLSTEELIGLSESLDHVENLSLSGGEPFIRPDLALVCRQFIKRNGVRQIYAPTNGYFTEKTLQVVAEVLQAADLDLFVVELSLDGMPAFHDAFRGAKNAFARAMETYDALADLQAGDPRLRIHAISTATQVNMLEIRQLTTYLYQRCPQMDHHNLALIRGDRKNPELATPLLGEYAALYEYMRALWAPREAGRYGAIVEPMLQWTKVQTLRARRQLVPCTAGKLSAVVYANGDVSLCELHAPIGNIRRQPFPEIWQSAQAGRLRQRIRDRECYCTTEVFMWPSIVFQPASLAKVLHRSKAWRAVPPLTPQHGPMPDLMSPAGRGLIDADLPVLD